MEQATQHALHTDFWLSGPAGSVALARALEDHVFLVDHLQFEGLAPNQSYGSISDGQVFDRAKLSQPTPGLPNPIPANPDDILETLPNVFINEWMARNRRFIMDPADDDSDDWFELFNGGTNTADLSGYFLSDKSSQPLFWRIPEGTTIAPGGFLLVWADEEQEQNDSGNPDLHAHFKLGADGDTIALSSPDGRLVDEIGFGPQQADVSQGRFPDGANALFSMSSPTPRGPNGPGSPIPNSPPRLTFATGILTNITWRDGFSVWITAEDFDVPEQTLTFSLLPPHPPAASIDPVTGQLTWVSTPHLPEGTYLLYVRVVDDGNPPLQADGVFSVGVVRPPTVTLRHHVFAPVVQLTFEPVPDLIYRVFHAPNLNEPVHWTQLGSDISVSSPIEVQVQDLHGTNTQRFYRVDVFGSDSGL
jgi:hypothetical protein